MQNFNLEFDKLNLEQKAAVIYDEGPLFLVAGAGTGKTKTLTMRIAHLIIKKKIKADRILALTFTNKATLQMKDRVLKMMENFDGYPQIYTFHAFCRRILLKNILSLNLGYKKGVNIIDESDAKKIISKILKELNVDIRKKDALSLISRIKYGYNEEVFEDYPEMFNVYNEYISLCIKGNLIDFDDLLVYTYELFLKDPEILKIYQNQFDHILVDEFQDTDLIQYQIIKLLNNKNTFVVGDPDQSIYEFRGANYENGELFIKEFDAKILFLNENYRSTNNILKVANALIEKNPTSIYSKKLFSSKGDGNKVQLSNYPHYLDEVEAVVYKIRELLKVKKEDETIAVLYRLNELKRPFEQKLTGCKISYDVYGGNKFFAKKEIKDIIAYLKILVNFNNDFYLKRIINVPKRSIGNKTIERLEDFADANNISLFEALEKIDISDKVNKKLKEFKNLILEIKEEIKMLKNVEDFIDIVYEKVNYKSFLENENNDLSKLEIENKISNIFDLKDVFNEFDFSGEETPIEKIELFLDELSLLTDAESNENIKKEVILSSIHQAKGLEFTYVFIIGIEDEILPAFKAINKDDIEEERRIFYVAITRAKRELYVSYCDKRMMHGKTMYSGKSVFIDDIKHAIYDNVYKKDSYKKNDIIKNKVEQNKTSIFKVGDLIDHKSFGKGIIVEIRDEIATISFSYEHGVKKISIGFLKK